MMKIAKLSLPRSKSCLTQEVRQGVRQDPPIQPPRVVRRKYDQSKYSSFCELITDHMAAWENDRRKGFIDIDPVALAKTPKISGSSFAQPWAVEVVSDEALVELNAETDRYAAQLAQLPPRKLPQTLPGNPVIFGIGPLKAPCNATILDSAPSALSKDIITTRAGASIAGDIVRSPYDVRAFKHLFVINHYGLHLVREMSQCKTTARGIAGHPQLADEAAIGGEAFFDPHDPGTVVINFGSGRFPPESGQAMDAAAKYWLACGMNKVVAVFADRDFGAEPYGIRDRYGKDLPNKVYLRETPVAMPHARSDHNREHSNDAGAAAVPEDL